MMSGSHRPMEGRVFSSVTARLEQALGLTLAEGDKLRSERERMREENIRLAREIGRLAQENQALRESAEIWIRMYENQLERANEALRQLAACTENRPEKPAPASVAPSPEIADV